MKTQITNYTFDASEKKITFSDYTTIRLDSVLLITNVTDNVIIYNFADSTKGGTVATNVLTLTYNTATMDDTDKLMIYYDDSDVVPATTHLQETLYSLTETIQELIQRLAPLGGAMANTAQLRAVVTGAVTATGGGYITSAQEVAALLTLEKALERYSANAVHSNINNVSIT